MPAILRAWPFRLVRTSTGHATLCVDEASGLLAEAGEGKPFFTSDGQPSEELKQILDFLGRLGRSQESTDASVGLLAEHGLLEAWPLKIRDGQRGVAVNGLRRVNEASLNALDAENLLALRDGGGLALAYAHLLSMGNVSLLGQLAAAHAGAAQPSPNRNGDLTKLFKPADDGQNMIDWKKLLDN